jgi:hypothetical protein
MALGSYPADNSFDPTEVLKDPTNKLRVSSPQSLIDTDFEYGSQSTKWENIAFNTNRPSAYESQTTLVFTDITMAANARVVTVTTTTPPIVGTPIFVRDTFLPFANGNYIVESVVASTSFTYTARSANYTAITSIGDVNKSVITTGSRYSVSQIGAAPSIAISGNQLTVTTTVPHALYPGNEISISGITGTNPPNGNHYVASIPSPTTFTYFANPTTGTPSGLTATSASIFARPQSQFLHRPYDGGMIFGSNSSSNNISATRQTRRYFRYQSGKAVQVSSGTVLKPYAGVEQVTSSGTTVTVRTREAHGIQVGAQIIMEGADESAYNLSLIHI